MSGRRPRHPRRLGAVVLVLALALPGAPGCARLRPYRTPSGTEHWQDPSPPRLSLAEKARAYQHRLEAWHQLPDGMIRYRFHRSLEPQRDVRGSYADGPFFQGQYLASQALRFAATGAPEARRQLMLALAGARLFAEVSGRPGLLARYYAPVAPAGDPRWQPSPSHPGYFWRSDVSKDQYAGFVHGLGVTLAMSQDPQIRAEIAPLAAAIADHLIENELRIVDWDGETTRYGDLRGRILGVPIGVNALIVLAAAKTAAVATGEARYRTFYERLVADGHAELTYWSHFELLGLGKRGNDNMAYLALYPLLLLEHDEAIARTLRRGARRTWQCVRDDHNAFFAFVHAAVVESPGDASSGPPQQGRERGRSALAEFPDAKLALPVDLTRAGFDFPRAFWNDGDGLPRSRRAVPLFLRPSKSSFWASDPFLLAGRLDEAGVYEFAGIDYLLAYWIGRHHGFLAADE